MKKTCDKKARSGKKAAQKNSAAKKAVAAAWPKANAYARFQKSLSVPRKRRDEECLRHVFAQAAGYNAVSEALAWAARHNVRYIIDRECVNVAGYYAPGTGVVALAECTARNPAEARRVLTHEIRHAWQDMHKMMPTVSRNFIDYFINHCLIEADAHAHDRIACLENSAMTHAEPGVLVVPARLLADVNQTKQINFFDWFSLEHELRYYGEGISRSYAKDIGLPGIAEPARNFEFRPYQDAKTANLPRAGIDVRRMNQVLALGRTYGGEKYLRNDDLLQRCLQQSLAASFYGVAKAEDIKLLAQIACREEEVKKAQGAREIRL